MIRAFIAVDLPADVRDAIGAAQSRLQQKPLGVKVSWSRVENLHLTLQFLGDVAEERLPVISAGLENALTTLSSFSVEVFGVGGFPDLNRPRVIWVGCRDNLGQLAMLADVVRGLGLVKEHREFAAHLTLGRIKFPRPDAALTRALDSLTTQGFGTMRVDEVHLFRSQLHPQGSIYTKISSHKLKGERADAGQS